MVFVISIFAGLMQLLGYLFYSLGTFSDKIKPNAASWSIWAFGAVLESASYIFLSRDLLKNILPIVCAFSAIIFFLICVFRGRFESISSFEKKIVALDIIITLLWYFSESAFLANMLLVLTAIISFIPIIIHVNKDPTYESALPWFIWTGAYVCMLFVVIVRWEKWEDVIYPVIFLILHLIVAILAVDFRKKNHLPINTGKILGEHL